MYLFKVVFAFLSVGGASYALIKAEKVPAWVKASVSLMSLTALIVAFTELPQAVDGLREGSRKIAELMPQAVDGLREGSRKITELMPQAVDGLREGSRKIAELIPKAAPRNAIYAKPDPAGRSYCGIDPNGGAYCCADRSKKLVMEYGGDVSPYAGIGGIRFWSTCY
jgi:hypothetical protein